MGLIAQLSLVETRGHRGATRTSPLQPLLHSDDAGPSAKVLPSMLASRIRSPARIAFRAASES
ncbi:MAG: hypothetical protein ACK5UV_01690, partial [bacterium]